MTERAIIQTILAEYGLKPTAVLDRQMGYRNRSYPVRLVGGTTLNLILYKSDADILSRIRNANTVSNYLAASSLLVRRLSDTRIVKLQTPGGRIKYAALYTYLLGATIPWEAYARRHLELLGATMSRLHAALEAMPQGNLPLAADEYRAILARMQAYFAQATVQAAAEDKLGIQPPLRRLSRLEHALDLSSRLPRQQPLHLDFVRGNILFQDVSAGPEVTGILDFEKTAFGHPVFDVARTVAFLLVDSKYKSEYHVRKYFLQSGYNKRGPVRFRPPVVHSVNRRLNLLEELIDLFLIHDFYKFLRHNPYEALPQNEHFIRTKSLLLTRGLIAPASRQMEIVAVGLAKPV
jgi:Ser/Thr protein kinase RdoA (MazF antagonist)